MTGPGGRRPGPLRQRRRTARSPIERARRAHLAIAVITVLVNAAFVLAPLTEPADSVDFGEDGGANVIDRQNVTAGINPIARPIYVLGDATCHQKASRSLFINGNQMPVCSRDVGVYLGLSAGAFAFLAVPRRYSMWWVLVLIIPLGIDGTVQLLSSYDSNNLLRLATGLMYGGVIGLLFVQISYEIHGIHLRRPRIERRIERALGVERPHPRDPFGGGNGDRR